MIIAYYSLTGNVRRFVENNSGMLRGVVASGNRNFGYGFAGAGVKISEQYAVPLIHTFELSGLDEDVRITNEGIDAILTVNY